MFAPDLLNKASWRNSFEIEDKQGKGLRLAKGLAAHNMRELPEDFELGEYDVICGRGRKCFHHIGNQRFREIVLDLLDKYSDSSSKLDKSYIICDVVNRVRKSSPLGGFVKRDANTGRYYEVGDFLAVSTRYPLNHAVIKNSMFTSVSLVSLQYDSGRRHHKHFGMPFKSSISPVVYRRRNADGLIKKNSWNSKILLLF